jgi:hypothetical protein
MGKTMHVPLRSLKLTQVFIFQVDSSIHTIEKLKEEIRNRILSSANHELVEQDEETIKVTLGDLACDIKLCDKMGCLVLFLTISNPSEDYVSLNWREDMVSYDDKIKSVLEFLPENPLSSFSIAVALPKSSEVSNLLRDYLDYAKSSEMGVSIVRGCVVVAPKEEHEEDPTQFIKHNMLLLPISLPPAEVEFITWGLIQNIRDLALFQGRLNQYYQADKWLFPQVEPLERETLKKIEQFFYSAFMKMRRIEIRQAEPLTLEDLEKWLADMTERFSTLTVIEGAMQRDYVLAEECMNEIEDLLQNWEEKPFEGYPKASSVERARNRALVRPFKDCLGRTRALREQLETVLDTVRTYLSLEQQRLGVEEQKSSKEQLVRLVNLQEILHKLEILIVAFYLTEMARIVFESTLHESANLLTAAFIPFALLTSILISRSLHKKG